jgi:hypothetical protein
VSKKRRELSAWQDYMSHEIDISKELDANFNIPNFHLMSHRVEEIRQYAALQQYSAERHDQVHKINLRASWNFSNHNLNYLPQAITFQRHIVYIGSSKLNLQALVQHRENSATTCKVLASGTCLAAPLRFQSEEKPKFIISQNRRDGEHLDAMIEAFRALHENTQEATHCVTIYNGTWEFLHHKSRTQRYISDVQLQAMELCIYRGINVHAEGIEGEGISQVCQCTGSQSLRGNDRRNNWVWVMKRLVRCCGAPNGCLAWQLQRLFKIQLLDEDGAFIECWLAQALTPIPQNLGTLDPVSKFVLVRKAPAANAFKVFSM